jgi:hypothetical protein
MSYAAKHKYLTVHWTMTASNIEEGQFGLRFDSSANPTQTELNACVVAIQGFWGGSSSLIGDDYRLASLKFAAIEANGLYPDGYSPLIHDFSPVVPGGTSLAISQYPLQVASVMSLTTAAARGRAHRGRAYLPPIAGNLDANYLFSQANCQTRANAFADLLETLNRVVAGPISVMSRIGAGISRPVTGVECGNRPDVQRRRAGRQAETYLSAVLN